MRKIVFWLHLVLGLASGLVVAWMAATGTVLAFQPLAIEWASRSAATVVPPEGAARLDLDALVAKVREKEGRLPGQFTVRRDPRAAAVAQFGRERTVYVDPYTGEETGEAPARLGAFFASVEHLHRWLSAGDGKGRDLGRTITHAACLVFGLLLLSGLILWWRGRVVALRLGGSGKARDWNWHNALGLWTSPLLLVIILTGLVMAYPWANALLFKMAGSPVPQERRGPGGPGGPGGMGGMGRMDWGGGGDQDAELRAEAWLAAAQAQVPGWQAITLRLPPRGGKVTLSIAEPSAWTPRPVSQLTVDAGTAEVVKWEPYASQNAGRRLRGWIRPLHTGEAFGPVHEVLNAAAAVAALVLVWTGFALAWRRFFRR